MIKWKKIVNLMMATGMAVSLTACGNGGSKETDTSKSKDTVAEDTKSAETKGTDAATDAAESGDYTLKSIDAIDLGVDYADLAADITVLSHRTDLVDTTFKEYIADFQKLYPNINIEYVTDTNYAESMTMKLTTDDWGDLCMIPTTINKNELPDQFISFGKLTDIDKIYNFNNNFAYDGEVYGIASVANAQGIVYNKKVFEEAGITELPKTPEEYLDALQKIKDNTDAIPMYSNFAAGWTMGAWDAYIGGSATGDPDFMNNGIVHGENPFSDRGDMTGPYAVYYVLYEATARGLIEDDPTTTDWEGCKGMINNGEIGTMVLGSWAVTQMQEAGDNPDDIAYMSFPITVDGTQYATAGPDYCFGINKNASLENQIASMLYVKWLTEESHFAYDQGGIPILKTEEYPPTLAAFEDIDFVVDTPAPAGEETLFNDINNDSEVGLNSDNTTDANILEAALTGSKTLDEIMDEWNAKWTAAQEKFGAEIVK